MKYDPILKTFDKDVDGFRKLICNSLEVMVISKRFSWDKAIHGEISQWVAKMSNNGENVDHVFIQLTAHILNRRFVIMPAALHGYSYDEKSKIEISPQHNSNVSKDFPPFYFLYFPEDTFTSGHYQSILPKERFSD